ncbi:fumarate reductase/succinate dehydrogenase flavo protein-like protein [Dunaliella salina]|uniref:Fumarate reductase/succinate dehydrogenase flavo protein-like protein n=1 Tax=Dunaliella salina TaxID=3046 RepID=A0ABQ7GU98_DUNSA|nr:fumarate reductase/succinate dehydrogenase flavo protein-like protein [Dunaliella salina]|eukprot:KAF5838195.1 fumarate reductase/succinate dehydrogenase flavo protein-like protein [Dunaliella salina]
MLLLAVVLCRPCVQLRAAAAGAGFSGAARPLGPTQAAWAAATRKELCDSMWRNCGIVRHRKGLKVAHAHAVEVGAQAKAAVAKYGVCTPLVELLNLATVAEITVACALQRRESRGGHFCVDYPHPVDSECRPSLVTLRPAASGRIPGVGVGVGGLGNLATLSSMASVPHSGVLASYVCSTAAGLGSGGQQVLSGYPRSLEAMPGNNATPAPPSIKGKAKKKRGGSQQRDLSVRSSLDKA